MTDKEQLELHALCEKYLDGSLSAEERGRLQEVLASNEEARRYYVRLAGLTASLHEYAGETQADEPEDVATASPPAAPSLVSVTDEDKDGKFIQWPFSARMALIASQAALLMMTLLTLKATFFRSEEVAEDPPVPRTEMNAQDTAVAVLTRGAGLKWAPGSQAYRSGDRLPAGHLRLEAGVGQIEFYSGATVVVEGPADLELISETEAHFHKGRIRAHVPPQAVGFRILTPDYQLVDLGTDFGMAVGEDGVSEVHVFDGEVELHGVDGAAEAKKLTTGAALRLQAAHEITGANFSEAVFPNPGMLNDASFQLEARYEQWKAFSEELKRDPSLVAYYTFEPAAPWDRVLRNEGQSGDPGLNGAVVGCQWAQGRWPQKRALDFKSPADRVRLKLDGAYEAITEAAWVRIDGLDRKWNSLLLTDTWERGNPHWQFSQVGELILGVGRDDKGGNFFSPETLDFDFVGRWVFLAVTFDPQAGEVRHYVNGERISTEAIAAVGDAAGFQPLRFGHMTLGNYQPVEQRGPWDVRNFNGRIDEFMLFERPLRDEEIASIYAAGQPNAELFSQR